MSFSLSSFKNPKVIKISLLVLVVVAVAVFSLIKLGVISADSIAPTYSYTGIMRTSTGHDVPNKLVANGTIALARYYVAANCSGASTAVSKQVKSDSKGSFTLTGLSKGCYSANLDGSVKNSTGQSSSIGVPMKIVVPAITQATAKNFWSDRRVYQLIGTFNREVPVVITPTATAEPTYNVSGTIKDSDGNPMGGVSVVSDTTYSPKVIPASPGYPARCDVGQRSIASQQTSADASGNFTLTGLPEGCHTLEISQPSTATVSWIKHILGSRALAASGKLPTSVTIVVPAGAASTITTVTNADGSVTVKVTVKPGTTIPKMPTPKPTTSFRAGEGAISGIIKEYDQNNALIKYQYTAVLMTDPAVGTEKYFLTNVQTNNSSGSYSVTGPARAVTLKFGPTVNCPASTKTATIVAGKTTTLNVNLTCDNKMPLSLSFEVMVGYDGVRPDITENGKVAILNDTTGKEIASVSAQVLAGQNWKYTFMVPVPNSDTPSSIKVTGFSNTRPGDGQPVAHLCQSYTLPFVIRPTSTNGGNRVFHLDCP